MKTLNYREGFKAGLLRNVLQSEINNNIIQRARNFNQNKIIYSKPYSESTLYNKQQGTIQVKHANSTKNNIECKSFHPPEFIYIYTYTLYINILHRQK